MKKENQNSEACKEYPTVFTFFHRLKVLQQTLKLPLLTLLLVCTVSLKWGLHTVTAQVAASNPDDATLVEAFRHVEVASVSDALEQVVGKKMYMSHRMRPIFPSKFAGFALTVLLKKETNHDPDALNGMLAAIDHGSPNSVYVMVVEDGADIAGMGGLMGTAMSARNFSGDANPRRRASFARSSALSGTSVRGRSVTIRNRASTNRMNV